MKKPDAVTTHYNGEIPSKMRRLDVRDLYMVGQATEEKLRRMGIFTIGNLANTEIEFPKYNFKSRCKVLWCFANGIECYLWRLFMVTSSIVGQIYRQHCHYLPPD